MGASAAAAGKRFRAVLIAATCFSIIASLAPRTFAAASMDSANTYTLAWTTTNATSATIDQGIGTVPVDGSLQVAPAVTTTYTLTATGPGGATSQSIVVTVDTTPAPTINADATPITLNPWETSTLFWTTTHAVSIDINGVATDLPPIGSIQVNPQATTTYTLTANGSSGGSAEATVTVTVNSDLMTGTTPLFAPVNGGEIAEAPGTGESTSLLGHGRILPRLADSVLAGAAMVRSTANGVLVNETGIPLSPEVKDGIMPVWISNVKSRGKKSTSAESFNTAVALSNQTAGDADVSFRLNNADGTHYGQADFRLAANTQMAAFFDQEPFNTPEDWEGTAEFTSSVPLVATALRTVLNERGEFLYTNVPVEPMRAGAGNPALSGEEVLPLVATGAGWTTRLFLTNPTEQVQVGTIHFFGSSSSGSASPIQLTVDGVATSTWGYSLSPHSALQLTLGGPSEPVRTASLRIVPETTAAPSTAALLSLSVDGTTISEASVSPETTGSSHRAYVESSSPIGTKGSTHTSLAITNAGLENNVVWLEAWHLDGTTLGVSRSVTLPPRGQIVASVSELFPEAGHGFQGIAHISSNTPVAVFVARVRVNERGESIVAATPLWTDELDQSETGVAFPFFATGGYYATEFVVFGRSGQAVSADLALLSQDGTLVAPEPVSSGPGSGSNKGGEKGRNK